jgi:hypothetical protein
MSFKIGAYATIWEIKSTSSPAVAEARISTSRKNKDGAWDTDFSRWVRFAGTSCADKILGMKQGDRIQIGECEVSSRYDKEKGSSYVNYTVFDFVPADSNVKYVVKKETAGYDEGGRSKNSYEGRKGTAAYEGDVSDKDIYGKPMPF